MIRRFDRDGRLLGSSHPPSAISNHPRHWWGHAWLAAGGSRVGLVVEPAQQYIEFSLDGKEVGRYALPGEGIYGPIVLCADDTVYVQRSHPGQLIRLDRGARRWNPVETREDALSILYGCDGQRLAVQTTGRPRQVTFVGAP